MFFFVFEQVLLGAKIFVRFAPSKSLLLDARLFVRPVPSKSAFLNVSKASFVLDSKLTGIVE